MAGPILQFDRYPNRPFEADDDMIAGKGPRSDDSWERLWRLFPLTDENLAQGKQWNNELQGNVSNTPVTDADGNMSFQSRLRALKNIYDAMPNNLRRLTPFQMQLLPFEKLLRDYKQPVVQQGNGLLDMLHGGGDVDQQAQNSLFSMMRSGEKR